MYNWTKLAVYSFAVFLSFLLLDILNAMTLDYWALHVCVGIPMIVAIFVTALSAVIAVNLYIKNKE